MSVLIIVAAAAIIAAPCEAVADRRNRRRASQSPFTAPYFSRASTAYWEQVGVNLQHAGLIGDINF